MRYGVKMASGWETGNYNSDTCADGGGYWQFDGWALLNNGVSVEYQNSSCGEFGIRVHAQFHMPDGYDYCIGVGTMDDQSIDNDDANCVASSIFGRYKLDMWGILHSAARAIEGIALVEAFTLGN